MLEKEKSKMLSGRKFRLERPTLAIDGVDGNGKRQTSYVPAGSVIKILSGPTSVGDRIVDVLWEGQTLTMFAIDVDVRGTEILDKSASA
jgi:hypothetical protein